LTILVLSCFQTIAETIVPQYTQGALFTPTLTPSGTGPLGDDRFGALQTAEALRTEVKDLNEKLEVLKGCSVFGIGLNFFFNLVIISYSQTSSGSG